MFSHHSLFETFWIIRNACGKVFSCWIPAMFGTMFMDERVVAVIMNPHTHMLKLHAPPDGFDRQSCSYDILQSVVQKMRHQTHIMNLPIGFHCSYNEFICLYGCTSNKYVISFPGHNHMMLSNQTLIDTFISSISGESKFATNHVSRW